MKTFLRILVDYSGSMGFMKGAPEFENKYLLPDGSPRIELVKKILKNVLTDLDFINFLNVITFRDYSQTRELDLKYIFTGNNPADAIEKIAEFKPPPIGGTPIFKAYVKSTQQIRNSHNATWSLLIVTDGDSNDFEDFDEKIINHQKIYNKHFRINIIGIDQDKEAEIKSKNLCENTGGKYINLQAINYNKDYVSKMLFEMKSSITNSSLIASAENSKLLSSKTELHKLLKEPVAVAREIVKEQENISVEKYISTLEKTVDSNTVAINLIGKQLELISAEIIRSNSIKFQNDEIFINEDPILNAKIGRHAEEIAYKYLSAKMPDINLSWENEITESFMQYDFSFVKENLANYIECKGTTGSEKYFYLSKNEWSFFIDNRDEYELILISELYTNPLVYHSKNLFKSILNGGVVPYSQSNRNIKNGLVYLRVL